jgi:hypothetical protein
MQNVRKTRVTRKRPGVVHVQVYFTKSYQSPADFEGDRTMPNDGVDLTDEEIRSDGLFDLRHNEDKRRAALAGMEKLEELRGYTFSRTFWGDQYR